MQVLRKFKPDENGKMLPNGCRLAGHGHGFEILEVAGVDYCLGCVLDAADKLDDARKPMFYSGSPYGSEIQALGAPPLKPDLKGSTP